MKGTDFWALPERTVILVRPSGVGARDSQARYEFTLGEIGPTARLASSGGLSDGGRDGSPTGFYYTKDGSYRAVTLTKRLSPYERDDAEKNWGRVTCAAYTAVRPHDVIGVWDEVRDGLLQERREYFARIAAEEKLREEREAAAEVTLREAQVVVAPAMEAAGLPSTHRALSKYAPPHGRAFTIEEVAQIVQTLQREDPS